jgi:exopolyphosphatase/guanosine-5'-triphosphate,3'-diphosphate pyrophosphatase
MRSETDCKGGGDPARDAARVLLSAPAQGQGLAGAARGEGDRGEPGPAANVYGALDLGTNNCRLLVARPSRRGFLVIDAFSRIIRLGEGVLHSGRLSDNAMARTVDALRVCSEKMRRRGVSRSRLIATEACRIAENSGEFIERVKTETGLSIEIVSRETEAKLAVSGCASLIDRNCDWALVFDIGGGSSELIWLDLSNLQRPWRRSLYDRVDVQNSIAAWTSLPVGVVSLAERHGGRDVTPEGYEGMVRDVMQNLAAFEDEHRFGERTKGRGVHFLGTSGTVTTIAGIHLALPVYERSRVDGCWLSAREAREVSAKLIAMSYAERAAQPCIGQERADLVLAGCAILEAMLRIWPCERLRVADRGLREGILATLMAEDGHDRRARPARS